jgi:hypothetical protein
MRKYRIVTALPHEDKPMFQAEERYMFEWIELGFRRFTIAECHDQAREVFERREAKKKFKKKQVWP